ncbi:MAG: TRAP transporter small permease [Myxococcota bacterium]
MSGVQGGAPSAPAEGGAPAPSPLKRIDDAIFAVEQAVIAAFLSAIAVMVFMDVVYRRLIAPDSKVGGIVAGFLGETDPAARAEIDANVAPWVSLVVGVLALWLAFWGARRQVAEPGAPEANPKAGYRDPAQTTSGGGFDGKALAYALGTGAALYGVGSLMTWRRKETTEFGEEMVSVVPSWVVYLGLAAVLALTYVLGRPAEERGKAGAQAGVGFLAFAALAISAFPEGYSGSKELSLVMLLWVGFLGASVCAYQGKHLRIESLQKVVPPRFSRYSDALGHLVTAAFCGFVAYLGYGYVFSETFGLRALGGVYEMTGIPQWIGALAIPVTFAMTTLRFVAAAVSALRGGSYGRAVGEADEVLEELRAKSDDDAGGAKAAEVTA